MVIRHLGWKRFNRWTSCHTHDRRNNQSNKCQALGGESEIQERDAHSSQRHTIRSTGQSDGVSRLWPQTGPKGLATALHSSQVLSSMESIQLKSDSCMFKNQSSSMFIIFVDDILVTGDQSEVNDFLSQLKKKFDLKHSSFLVEGSWIQVIGRKLHRRSQSVTKISMMESFFTSLYAIYQMERANPVSAPGVKRSPLPDQSMMEKAVKYSTRYLRGT
eukprot:5278628-Amphidinium_carterae.3